MWWVQNSISTAAKVIFKQVFLGEAEEAQGEINLQTCSSCSPFPRFL